MGVYGDSHILSYLIRVLGANMSGLSPTRGLSIKEQILRNHTETHPKFPYVKRIKSFTLETNAGEFGGSPNDIVHITFSKGAVGIDGIISCVVIDGKTSPEPAIKENSDGSLSIKVNGKYHDLDPNTITDFSRKFFGEILKCRSWFDPAISTTTDTWVFLDRRVS